MFSGEGFWVVFTSVFLGGEREGLFTLFFGIRVVLSFLSTWVFLLRFFLFWFTTRAPFHKGFQ